MEISELKKSAGTWCPHVVKGRGCAIYAERPSSCASFGCGYLHWPMAGDHWFPFKSKMVIVAEDAARMAIHVDPNTPHVWKSEPYYSDLKRWSWHAAQHQFQQIVVAIGRRMVAVLPDKDVDLGRVAEDEVVLTGQLADGSYSAMKFNANDPAIKGLRYGQEYKFKAPRLPG
ncbi:hypothetical protein [Sphingopyxis sp. LC81]|uniref:hypothetical protein n=1 Tax=Sphingopyxis sp. LC81 TaxID=1502850 RepID=UPI0012699E98|nr:hypothetical protein [Sphingopyxis sp. LC81]